MTSNELKHLRLFPCEGECDTASWCWRNGEWLQHDWCLKHVFMPIFIGRRSTPAYKRAHNLHVVNFLCLKETRRQAWGMATKHSISILFSGNRDAYKNQRRSLSKWKFDAKSWCWCSGEPIPTIYGPRPESRERQPKRCILCDLNSGTNPLSQGAQMLGHLTPCFCRSGLSLEPQTELLGNT